MSIVDPNGTFAQDDSISFVLSDLKTYARNLRRLKHPIELAVPMDNLYGHKGQNVVDKMKRNHMLPPDHPPYSPDLTPCDLWLFGVLKN
jgi:transposase